MKCHKIKLGHFAVILFVISWLETLLFENISYL